MSVSRREIISRGIHLRCPNCGGRTLFTPGSMRVNRKCPGCGVGLNHGEGVFLGPMVINYAVAVAGFAVPCVVLGAVGVVSWSLALGLAAGFCLLMPFVFYRASWSLWLMLYFCFLPERLPANSDATGRDDHG